MAERKRLGILTSGGDCAGLNAVIRAAAKRAPVDGKAVPVRHFGLLLSYDAFDRLAERFKRAGTEFLIDPYVRFEGQAGEQKTMFVKDPAGNALEFKAFKDDAQVFATG